MMNLSETKEAFIKLGQLVANLSPRSNEALFHQAKAKNPWFIMEHVDLSLKGIANYLDEKKFDKWLSQYNVPEHLPKNIGLVMAGNIPLVGFHDLLCVLISGHNAVIKLSSQDDVLLPFLLKELGNIDPRFSSRIFIKEQLKEVDAVIATGSDNSARYFKYYFSKIPHIIRKNRNSCAVLSGNETRDELKQLGADIFTYFGLGCRNVSKLFVPEGFDMEMLIDSFETYKFVVDHHKYGNNYDYQKAVLLMNQISFIDSGFCLLVESEKLASPVSVIYYEKYLDVEDVKKKLLVDEEKIQCITTSLSDISNAVPLGKAQMPELWDYADNVDTLGFLLHLDSE